MNKSTHIFWLLVESIGVINFPDRKRNGISCVIIFPCAASPKLNSRSYFLNYLCSKFTTTLCFLPKLCYSTSRKMKFPTNDLFSECDQIGSFLMILLHLLKKSLMENFIFCAVQKLILFSFILPYFFWMIEDCLCWVTQRNQVALVLMDFYNCLIFLEIFCVIVKIRI